MFKMYYNNILLEAWLLIKEELKKRNLRPVDIAKKTGYSEQRICDLYNRRNVSDKVLSAITEAFNISLDISIPYTIKIKNMKKN